MKKTPEHPAVVEGAPRGEPMARRADPNGAPGGSPSAVPVRLRRRGDQVVLERDQGGEPIPVKLLWAQPIGGRGRYLAILDGKKTEVAMLRDLDELEPASRRIAEEDLAKRYVVPRITRVCRTRACFGMRYLRVETDRGERSFAFKDATRDVVWVTDDHVMLRDTMGCRYEINPFSGLDSTSQREARKVL